MSRTFLFAFAVLVACLVACGKSDTTPPKPFTGKLTIDRINKIDAGRAALCEDTWDLALAKLEARLGKPTAINGDYFSWAATDGTSCAYVRAVRGECPASWKKPGPRLWSVSYPVVRKPSDEERFQYDRCMREATGQPDEATQPGA